MSTFPPARERNKARQRGFTKFTTEELQFHIPLACSLRRCCLRVMVKGMRLVRDAVASGQRKCDANFWQRPAVALRLQAKRQPPRVLDFFHKATTALLTRGRQSWRFELNHAESSTTVSIMMYNSAYICMCI